jgi:hemolysin activation/secretion protein
MLIVLCGVGAVTAAPAATQEAPATASAVTAAAESRFDVFELRVLGNTRLDETAIDSVLYRFLGPQRTLKDVEAARQALESLYHERGYGAVFVDIPEQSVAQGLVRLHVTESALGRVTVSGARYFSNRQILAALPEAQPGATPQLPVLQAEVAAINGVSRDRQVTPVLKAGKQPGTVDLNLKVEDHLPLHASLELNNQYTVDTKPLRAAVGLSYEDLFGRFDTLSAQFQTSPQDRSQVAVWTGSYATHVGDGTKRLAGYYFHSNSSVATLNVAGSSVTVLGKGTVTGLRLIMPLPATDVSLQTFTLGADYKDFLQDISGRSRIYYLNLSAAYSGGWRRERAQTTFSATSNFGVRGAPNNPQLFENKRYLGSPNYFYVRSAATLDLSLSKDLRMHLSAAGQYSATPLISNEEFSIAGADGVRGYFEAEELGDRGFKLSIQLGPPPWPLFGDRLTINSYAFYDYGHMGVLDPLPQEQSALDLASTGVGLDIAGFKHFSASLAWADALRAAARTRRNAARVLFSVRTEW